MAQGDLDIVKGSQADQLAFAAAVAQLAIFHHLGFELDVHKFFGRHRHEAQIASHGLGHFRVAEGYGRTHNAGELGIVAAAMGSTGFAPGVGMIGNGQGVHLTDHRQGGAFLASLGLEIAFHAGDGQAGLTSEAQFFHFFHKFLAGAMFFVSQLSVAEDIPAKGHDLVFFAVDDLTDFFFDPIHWFFSPFPAPKGDIYTL